ncbi:MAG: S8 family serine peptidase [Dehalococcoidia bacterium]
MHITVKSCILLALSITCLLLGWQGVSVSSGANYSNAESTVTSLPVVKSSIIIDRTIPDISGSYADIPVAGQTVEDTQMDFRERWLAERVPRGNTIEVISGNSRVIVAVLDTGIDSEHEDLINTVINEVNLTESPVTTDIHGHGTHIAGIIAADVDNGLGIEGIAPDCLLLNVKVADDKGGCHASDLVEGIIWSVNHGADIINISIQIEEYSSALEEAVDYAWNSGVAVIAAAGNDGSDVSVYPAGYDNCISVTALKNETDMAPLANFGDWIDAAAPGYRVYSTLPGNTYGYKHGTSFAAAFVTGIAAELYPTVIDTNANGRTNDEIRDLILSLCGFDSPDRE